MAKHSVRVICWERSHMTELILTDIQEKKLESDIPKLKKVCPDCKPDNRAIAIVSGNTIFLSCKPYRCENGHLSLISPMATTLHVKFGPDSIDYVNIEGKIDELPNLIDAKEIACNHVVDGKPCDCRLTALDDTNLSYPSSPAIKTRLRLGDLWDRHGVEPVRGGKYTNEGDYKESRSQQSNKQRLSRMQRDRLISEDRHPGKRINRATNTDYGHRDKSSLNPD
jgi:hypothetical protein